MYKKYAIVGFLLFLPLSVGAQTVLYESYENGGEINVGEPSVRSFIGTFVLDTPTFFDNLSSTYVGIEWKNETAFCHATGNFKVAIASSTANYISGPTLWETDQIFHAGTNYQFDTITNSSGSGGVWLMAGYTYGIHAITNCGSPFINTVVSDPSNLIYYGFLSWDGNYEETFLDISGRTRIVSVDPTSFEVVSSSTPFTVGAEIYVNESDFEDGMILRQKITQTNKPFTIASFVFPVLGIPLPSFVQALFTDQGLTYDIEAFGSSSYSTTTDVITSGLHTLTTEILQPRPLSSIFGYGTVVMTTTYFVVGSTTISDQIFLGLADLAVTLNDTATSTFAQLTDSCNPLSGFSIVNCITALLWPSSGQIESAMAELEQKVLVKAPLGYVTRFVAILNDTATSSLPAIAYEFGASSPLSGAEMTFDFQEIMDESSVILNTTLVSDRVDPKTVMELFMPLWQVLVYAFLFFMIIKDVSGLYKRDI